MIKRAFTVFCFVAVVATFSRAATAQRPQSRATGYSAYEREAIDQALRQGGLSVDPSPEGKTVEHIEIVRLEVLEPRDPVPENVAGLHARSLLNSLHYKTRDFIIRREMLVREGETYVQVLVDETARNLRTRTPLQLSVVLIVPVQGSDADHVSLLAIVKDVWSLRLSYDFALSAGGLENFLLVPQETNLLGLHHTAQTRFQYQPESYTFGLGYTVPRFGWSWVGASAVANVIFNRRSFEAEGATASFSAGQSLYSTRTEWSWSATGAYNNYVVRRYVNAQVGQYDSPSTPDVAERIPTEYRNRSFSGAVGVIRSFGWGIKNNIGLTLNIAKAEYVAPNLEGVSQAAADDFTQRFLPLGETRVYPALGWTTYRNDFLRTLDITTLSLQEDFRLGHTVSASFYPVPKALGSTRDLLGFTGSAGYTVALGDGFVGATATALAESEAGTVTDGSVGAALGMATPRFGVGRVVMNASFLNRYRNYLRAVTYEGGDGRLRGYPSKYFFGKDSVFYNVEFRSTGLDVLKVQVGGVAFYDAGDAAQGFDMLRAKHAVGAGVRILFPQLNRQVLRADVAIPLNRGPFPETGITSRVAPVSFFVTFDQAFQP